MAGCSGQTLRLTVAWESDRAVVTVAGEIDMSNVDELTACIEALMQRGEHHIAMDLSQVTYLGAAGLNALLRGRAAAAAEGGGVTVSSSSVAVDHLMDVTATRVLLRPDQEIHLDAPPVLDFVTEWSSADPDLVPPVSGTAGADDSAVIAL
jgi:anti-anti-sigma factor